MYERHAKKEEDFLHLLLRVRERGVCAAAAAARRRHCGATAAWRNVVASPRLLTV